MSSDKLNLLLILPEFPPKIGGMQTHALYLARHLHKKGHQIEVLTYFVEEDSFPFQNVDARESYPVQRVLSRISFWKNIRIIKEIVESKKPDIIYSSTVFYGVLEKECGVPVICRSVGNDVERPWIPYPYQFGTRWLNSWGLERKLYRLSKKLDGPEWMESFFQEKRVRLMRQSACQSKKILANSHYTAERLREIGVVPDRISVLSGGVEFVDFARPEKLSKKSLRQSLGLPEEKTILMTACRLVEKKGVDFLIQFMWQIKQLKPELILLIIGDGHGKKKYEKLTKRLKVEDRVIFSGKIPVNVLAKYYWAADIFTLASKDYVNKKGLRDVETMGRVLCEANAAGIPVLAARSGGIPSIIENEVNGLLFEPGNQKDFTEKFTQLYEDPQLQRNMVEKGVIKAQQLFDWKHILESHEKVFFEERKKPFVESLKST